MQFSFTQYTKKNKVILMLTALAGLYYFIILHTLGSFDFIRNSLFSTPDSLDYLAYADWLAGHNDQINPNRTFFFPLLIFVSNGLLGSTGIWILQFAFWLGGCILVYKTAARISDNKWLPPVSFILAASNLSLIVYTAHALTEVPTFFFLALLMYLLSFSYLDQKNPAIWAGVIFIMSTLATIRPVFQVFWYLLTGMVIFFNWKNLLRRPILILLIVLAASPVIFQKTINIVKYGSYSSTGIADHNMKYYFYTKVKFTADGLTGLDYDTLPDSVYSALMEQASQLSKDEIRKYLIAHPKSTLSVFWDNLKENLMSGNSLIDRDTHRSLWKWTKNTNHNFIFYIHLLMTLAWLYYIATSFRTANKKSHYIFIAGLMQFYILYSSGIAYWAGDRLVIPSLAIWSVLYPLLVSTIVEKLKVHSTKHAW